MDGEVWLPIPPARMFSLQVAFQIEAGAVTKGMPTAVDERLRDGRTSVSVPPLSRSSPCHRESSKYRLGDGSGRRSRCLLGYDVVVVDIGDLFSELQEVECRYVFTQLSQISRSTRVTPVAEEIAARTLTQSD